MTEANATKAANIWNVALPWSEGAMSARMWIKGRRVMVDVPELDIACTGKTQSEALFRLFALLLKYYQELKEQSDLSARQQEHMRLLKDWVQIVSRKMTSRELSPLRR